MLLSNLDILSLPLGVKKRLGVKITQVLAAVNVVTISCLIFLFKQKDLLII